jgi:hypothetical protein
MITVFEDIPEIFVDYYNTQFETWGREFRSRGRGKHCAIVFDVLPGQVPTLDVAGNLAWSGAWLTATLERVRGGQAMVIRPATDWDRNRIEMHSWNLKRVMLT